MNPKHNIIFEGAELSGKSYLMSQVFDFLEPKYNSGGKIMDGCHWFNCDVGIFGTKHGEIALNKYLDEDHFEKANRIVEEIFNNKEKKEAYPFAFLTAKINHSYACFRSLDETLLGRINLNLGKAILLEGKNKRTHVQLYKGLEGLASNTSENEFVTPLQHFLKESGEEISKETKETSDLQKSFFSEEAATDDGEDFVQDFIIDQVIIDNSGEVKFKRATELEKRGEYTNAIGLYESTRDIMIERGRQEEGILCDERIANAYLCLNKGKEALGIYEKLYKFFNKKKDHEKLSVCEMNIGIAYQKLGNTDQAINFYESAIESFEKYGMESEIALCKMNLAISYNELSEYKKAIKLLKSAIGFFSKCDMKDDMALCELALANAYAYLDYHQNALHLYKNALLYFTRKDMWIEAAATLRGMANSYTISGSYEKAMEYIENAIEIFKALDLETEIANCKATIAEMAQKFSKYEVSIKYYEEARITFLNYEINHKVADCDMNMATVYLSVGEYKRAIELLKSAKVYYQEMNLDTDMARCDMKLAAFKAHSGNHESALQLLQNASEIFEKQRMEADAAVCKMNIADILSFMGKSSDALVLYKLVFPILAEKNLYMESAYCAIKSAHAMIRLGFIKQAQDVLNSVKNTYKDHPVIKSLYLTCKAKAFKEKGDLDKARSAYGEVIEELEDNVYQLTQHRLSFLNTSFFKSTYFEMIDLCIQGPIPESAITYIERLKSRTLGDLIGHQAILLKNVKKKEIFQYKSLSHEINLLMKKIAIEKNEEERIKKELRQKISEHSEMIRSFKRKNPEFDLSQKKIIEVKDIMDILHDNKSMAIIEMFFNRNRLVVFIVNGHTGNISFAFVDELEMIFESTTEMWSRYNNFRKAQGMEKKRAKEKWESCLDSILKLLYRKIFLKLEPHLKGINKIKFIPYSFFHLLPLHAMYTEKNSHRIYLMDDYEVSYAPSIKILKICNERKRDPPGPAFIAWSNPNGLEELLFAKQECAAICNLFRESQIQNQATWEHIVHGCKNARYFHHIGHAHPGALILHDPENAELSKEHFVPQIFKELDLSKSYMVTLSACEAGLSQIKGSFSEELIGISTGLLNRGAPAVISSLWMVENRFTRALMEIFYKNIRNGMGRVKALKDAQLKVRRIIDFSEFQSMVGDIAWADDKPPDVDFSRPYYWAGFIYSGAG